MFGYSFGPRVPVHQSPRQFSDFKFSPLGNDSGLRVQRGALVEGRLASVPPDPPPGPDGKSLWVSQEQTRRGESESRLHDSAGAT